MEGNENYGLIVKMLRQRAELSVRDFAKSCGRSVGWLSEIENGRGLARIDRTEFDRLVELLKGDQDRAQFKTWIATYKNAQKVDRVFDGAILKHLRLKKRMRLSEVASRTQYSVSHLSRIEHGLAETTTDLRNEYMKACGYSPENFKNLTPGAIRSKAVPISFKLNILIRKLPENKVEELFYFAQNLMGMQSL